MMQANAEGKDTVLHVECGMPSGQFPTGTVTFLFTDIEGSTKLWEASPQEMKVALARHDALMREAIDGSGGFVFKTIGDAFCASFATVSEAVEAALVAQLALVAEPWPEATPVKVRMALHTGAAEIRDGDYFGPPVNRVARLLAIGHGGQTLLSQTTYDLVRDHPPAGSEPRSMGEHRLKDLSRPESVYQLNHPGLPSEFPQLRSLDNPALRHNLPPQLTSFIGREREIEDVKGLLAKSRLLTLSGSGGSGKTRLALQVAADLIEEYGQGVWLVELAQVSEPGLVPQTIASVLGLKEEPGKSLSQTLIEHLRNKRLLLVLDNCEHLLDACSNLVDSMIRQCAGVQVLATSREALGISGEQTYRVPSLAIPDLRQTQSPESLSLYAAVRLFIDRALLVKTDFRVTNRNAPALASICHRLDGIPLAIELAAARVRSLSVEEVDERLDERFRLLTGGSRTAMPRQQTLRALIDWSYDLLNERERILLGRLSVFCGGWRTEDAEKVCAGEGISDWEVLDLMTSLADKSLIVFEEVKGAGRHHLLETVRQYARDRLLESGESQAVHSRHRNHFLKFAVDAEPELKGTNQGQWFSVLDDEHENLRAALVWSIDEVEETQLLRLCAALWWYWFMRGLLSEGRAWCERALEAVGASEPTALRADVLAAAGILATYRGDFAAASLQLEECLAIRKETGDAPGVAACLGSIAHVAGKRGESAIARGLYEQSLAVRREIGDRRGTAGSLGNLGIMALAEGDHAAAQRYMEECLAIMRDLGDQWGISTALNNLGTLYRDLGDASAALACYEESLAIEREIGDRHGISVSLSNLGVLTASLGRPAAARTYLEESLGIKQVIGDLRSLSYSLEAFASLAVAEGDVRKAPALWASAESVREKIGAPLPPREREQIDLEVAAVRQILGDEPFSAAWAKGRGMTLDQAIELALDRPIG